MATIVHTPDQTNTHMKKAHIAIFQIMTTKIYI